MTSDVLYGFSVMLGIYAVAALVVVGVMALILVWSLTR